jgi:hypothetical protein
MTVRRERLLPRAGDVVARVGQEVSPVQVVARMSQDVDFHILPICEQLRILPEELNKHLLVEEGAAVQIGTPLVGKRGPFGKPFRSPAEGTFLRASNGRIILQQTADWFELRAMMHSRVVSQRQGRGVVLEADGSHIQAIWSSGKEGYGKLISVVNDSRDALSADSLRDDMSGHVLVAGSIDDRRGLRRALEIDVRGLIAGSITAELCQLASSLPFPIIITDGIGHQSMAQPIFQLLVESEEQEASLFGRNDEFSSNDRPEIIISLSATPKIDAPPSQQPLGVGQTVRILRAPFNSLVGEIVRLNTHLRTTNIGTKVHGADVRLPDGQVVLVPFANLDVIIS